MIMDKKEKIKIKIGILELEYEGESVFSGDELDTKLEKLLEKMKEVSKDIPKGTLSAEGNVPTSSKPVSSGSQRIKEMSINNFAKYYDIKTINGTIVCAVAYLEVIRQKENSSRDEIRAVVDEIKYKPKSLTHNWTNNFEKVLKGDQIEETSSKGYYLSKSEREEIDAKLANRS